MSKKNKTVAKHNGLKTTNNKPQNKSITKIQFSHLIFPAGILILTYILFSPVSGFDFVNWDDDRYVIDNPYLEQSSWESIRYFFSNFYFLMYLPITMLTYVIDYKIGGGLNPGVFHTTSMIFHLCNSTLVFFVFRTIFSSIQTKYKDIGATIVAVLFAITPMHIESVAWIAERKDVVYTFFYLLSLMAYLKYFKSKKLMFYLTALFLFILSIISKAQAMTLPIVLILIDYLLKKELPDKKNILEKIPFFIISIFFGILAIMGTRADGESANAAYTVIEKMIYASYGFVTYIVKLFVPYKLSVIYPYPEAANHEIPLIYWLYLIPSAIVVAATVWFFRKRKEISFGFAFFITNIVIVLQIFAYHNFIMADRYSYVSSLGLFFIFAFIITKIISEKEKLKIPILVAFGAYIIFLFGYSQNRIQDWKDSITLWQDVRSKYPEVLISYYNGANAKAEIGDKHGLNNQQTKATQFYKDALADYDHAIFMKKDYVGALSNRGITRAKLGMVPEALSDFNEVVKIDSLFNNVYSNRGNAKMMLGDVQGAIADYDKAIELNPDYLDALFNRGMAKLNTNKWQEAISDFERIITINQNYNTTYYYLGMCYSNINKYDKAIECYNKALKQNPNSLDAYYNRGVTLFLQGKTDDAIKDYNIVIKTNPKLGLPYYQRGLAMAKLNKKQEACADLNKAKELGVRGVAEQMNKYCK